jgi:hypothetical protein
MDYTILSKENINGHLKYRISTNGIVVVLWFKYEPSEEEIERSVNRILMG